jgi:hypothetical protein
MRAADSCLPGSVSPRPVLRGASSPAAQAAAWPAASPWEGNTVGGKITAICPVAQSSSSSGSGGSGAGGGGWCRQRWRLQRDDPRHRGAHGQAHGRRPRPGLVSVNFAQARANNVLSVPVFQDFHLQAALSAVDNARFLHRRQRQPKIVAAYFQEASVRYAAAQTGLITCSP